MTRNKGENMTRCLGTLLHKKKEREQTHASNRAPWKILTRMIHLCRRLKFYFSLAFIIRFETSIFLFFFFFNEISFQLFQTSFYFNNSVTFKKSCSLQARISKIDLIRMLILHIWRNFIVLVNLLDWLLVSRCSCKNIYAILRRQHLSFFNIASDIFFAPSCFFLQFRAKWNRKEILSKRDL